ncbi:MAG: type II toxin-antitoxin system YafQ family toxin [Candidatus Pacebacteria bacterium]|nr:type II toxin-antitoxin system YafQ family toxin [Candidatus Paceibacterota bacterium]
MRKIEWSSSFKRDYKRIKSGRYKADIDLIISEVLECLSNDKPLAQKYRDHQLHGKFRAYRECHLKPDLLLIYYKIVDNRLILYRLGSHSDLELT